MTVRVVRLGSPRAPAEGLRIGTVRRPPRGVPKAEFASRDFSDVWLPELSPSQELVSAAQRATTEREWTGFVRAYRVELATPAARHLIELRGAEPSDRHRGRPLLRGREPLPPHGTRSAARRRRRRDHLITRRACPG